MHKDAGEERTTENIEAERQRRGKLQEKKSAGKSGGKVAEDGLPWTVKADG